MRSRTLNPSRRLFLRASTAVAGTSAFTIIRPELVRGAGNERLKAGLVGCGGRGTQAVVDMLTGTENVELVAMADVFEDHLEGSLKRLRDPKYIGRNAGIGEAMANEKTAEELVSSIPSE